MGLGMKICDIFELAVARHIPAVTKVDDIDPATIQQELGEYVITTPIEKALTDFLEIYAESRIEKTDKIGVWISGFFGSGKSHFAKILSYLLWNLAIGDAHAIDLFRQRLGIEGATAELIREQLHRIQQIDSHVVMFNIEALKRKDSIAETMYRQYLAQERGLSDTIVVGRLELSLLRRGLYEPFKQLIKTQVGESWEIVREDFSMVRAAVAQALTELDKKLYPDVRIAERALDDMDARALSVSRT